MGRQLDEHSVFFWRPAIYVTSLSNKLMMMMMMMYGKQ